MQRLLVAIVQSADADPVVDALTSEGFRVTRLGSTGGFLKQASATLLVGVEDDDGYAAALGLIERHSSSRDVEPPPVLLERLADWQAAVVHHGGATVFVLPLERVVRL